MDNVKNGEGVWTTKCEVEYLNKIGTHNTDRNYPKLAILKRYKESMKLRKNWAGMSKEVIEAHVDFLIKHYGGAI